MVKENHFLEHQTFMDALRYQATTGIKPKIKEGDLFYVNAQETAISPVVARMHLQREKGRRIKEVEEIKQRLLTSRPLINYNVLSMWMAHELEQQDWSEEENRKIWGHVQLFPELIREGEQYRSIGTGKWVSYDDGVKRLAVQVYNYASDNKKEALFLRKQFCDEISCDANLDVIAYENLEDEKFTLRQYCKDVIKSRADNPQIRMEVRFLVHKGLEYLAQKSSFK